MARRPRKMALGRTFQRVMKTMTRAAVRVGTQAIRESLRATPLVGANKRKRTVAASSPNWMKGVAIAVTGPRRYWLFKPAGVRRNERLPLLVMLHGCGQDAEAFAASSRMNRIAGRERFFVLYPEQERLANVQRCWNWFDTRTGRAQAEANSIAVAIEQVCMLQPIDRRRIALAGISAGAGMAMFLAARQPERFRAVAVHSGVAPGLAHSSLTAIKAMSGRHMAPAPLPSLAPGMHWPALLVIHGSADRVVAPGNGIEAVIRWSAPLGAKPGKPRLVQRGTRYAATITDYRNRGRLVATLCEVDQLGHAWSGGAAGVAFSDPKGPDASRMIWSFVARQFAGETTWG